ncbi:hypothetical protein PIB30_038556 [Stylosanthes scabra]|uniref:Uncharacterized protein n=1 Tax=Stylosanthes scabra TaxID=79078 RepID=A0ABU6YGG7_9FABA|nr:hypothetical protein [Stylosanthes scabra]
MSPKGRLILQQYLAQIHKFPNQNIANSQCPDVEVVNKVARNPDREERLHRGDSREHGTGSTASASPRRHQRAPRNIRPAQHHAPSQKQAAVAPVRAPRRAPRRTPLSHLYPNQ